MPDFVWPYADGCFTAAYFGYCEFMIRELGLKFDKLFDAYAATTKLSLIYPFDDMCILSQKPTKIHMRNGLLHKDGGMAVKYADGFGSYALNGVRVPEYLAVTPDGDLKLEFFKKEESADVRAEFIRKFGKERMRALGRSIDSHKKHSNRWWSESEYELIDMSSIYKPAYDYAPHLWMKNQTTGVFHLEGVEPSCRTIEQALNSKCGRNVSGYKIIGVK